MNAGANGHRQMVAELLARGAEEGCLLLSEVERLVGDLELSDDEVEAFYQEIDERQIPVRDDFGRERASGPRGEVGEDVDDDRRVLRVVFALWPAWVSFSLIASGKHFWLDIAAGLALAAAGAWVARRLERNVMGKAR